MTVLAKIRNRAGLLIAVVGIALLTFILQSALESGNYFFSTRDSVGEIGGKTISYREFDAKVQEAIEAQKRNTGKSALTDSEIDGVVQQTWGQMLNDLVMKKEYASLGIAVSEDELYESMLGKEPHPYITQYFTDRSTGQIFQPYATPMGTLNMGKVLEYNQNMNQEQEASWVMLENAIKEARINAKYLNLIKKGLYVTTSEAKNEFIAENKTYKINYVVKRYESIPDTAVKVTEADLKKYYNENLDKFKIEETTRKIEYIAFDAYPSAQDSAALQEDLKNISAEFKTKKGSDDSLFVISESDSRMFDASYHKKGSLPSNLDTLFNAPVGTVLGPYKENNTYKLAKLEDVKTSADSAKVRHILIAHKDGDRPDPSVTITKEQAKAKADSLVKILKTGKVKFEDFVKQHSNDKGSLDKGGDYGWFNDQSGFVDPFKNAGLDGKKGEIKVVETQFGYHIIEVLDRKGESKKIRVATIDRTIIPGTETIQAQYRKASEFAGKYNESEAFMKAIDEQKLNKRVADNVKESDKMLPGLESPRELIRWAYSAEKGQVSPAFEFGNRFIVAHLTDIKEKGEATLEQVKDEVEKGAIREKKAEKLIAEFNTALQGASNITAFSTKVNEAAQIAENVTFASAALQGVGQEYEVTGVATTLKQNALSKPVKGNAGVFVISVLEIKDAPAITDYTAAKNKALGAKTSRVDYEVFDALKENANVTDNKAKFY